MRYLDRNEIIQESVLNELIQERTFHSSRDSGLIENAVAPPTNKNLGLVLRDCDESLFSPVGFDLRVAEVYREKNGIRSRLTSSGLHVLLSRGEIEQISSTNGKIILEGNNEGKNVYYIVSQEKIQMPSYLSLFVDAKSTTGRTGCMCNLKSSSLITMNPEPAIVSAQPYGFDLAVTPGDSRLVQAVLMHKHYQAMSRDEVIQEGENIKLRENGRELNMDGLEFIRNRAPMTYQTTRVLKAKPREQTPGPIDMDSKARYDPLDYFEIIKGNTELELEPKALYLLSTQETIHFGDVAGFLSRETLETGTGLWGHFAGVFQSWYNGTITMEVRSECPRVIGQGDLAGLVEFDKIQGDLEEKDRYNGTYQNQIAPQPPKMFKPIDWS